MTRKQLVVKTKFELMELAKRLGLRGISTLKKEELADKIQVAQQERQNRAAKRKSGLASGAKRAAAALKRRAVRKRPSDENQSTRATVRSTTVSRSAEIAAHKFDVAPSRQPTPQTLAADSLGELPQTYGTGRMFLTARDPHWLYAYWDFSQQQMDYFRQQAGDRRLVLRLYETNKATPVQEIALQSDSRNWYVYVNKAATTYTAQLGYSPRQGAFKTVAESRETTTPPEMLSPDESAPFVTIPLEIPFRDIHGMVRDRLQDNEPLGYGLQRLQQTSTDSRSRPDMGSNWSESQATAMTHLVWDRLLQRSQSGSVEISEWLRRQLSQELSSGVFSGQGVSPTSGSWQVAMGKPGKGFWFAVNAELIIYGATEPNARVTIDGKRIDLRPDGTFSFHYVFPDGRYSLPVVAVSAAGDDQRAVDLEFQRASHIHGDVGQVKQPAHLKAPAAA